MLRRLMFHSVQVKAEKHSARSCFDEDGYCSSPRTPGFNEETAFSLVCSITPPSHSHSDTIGMLIYLFPKLHLELRPGYPLLANSNMPSVFEIAP
jgi:hypothetical protein